MPKMIPEFCMDAPPGETKVFAALRDAGDPSWIILHSVDISAWNGLKKTEIDFIVIIPSKGILCIEVKSHERIEYINGVWLYNGKPKWEKKDGSPFTQIDDAVQSLIRRLRAQKPNLSHIPIQRCVIFPSAPFTLPTMIEANSDEFLDAVGFEQAVENGNLGLFLERCLTSATPEKYRLHRPLNQTHLNEFVAYLRPQIRNEPGSKRARDLKRLEIEKILREQQKPVLALAARNPRLVVDGGAGTGKTLVALELAQRWSENGSRVGLLCHRRMVGNWLGEQTIMGCPGLVRGPLADILVRMLWPDESASNPDPLSRDFPKTVFKKLSADPDLSSQIVFDALIFDESQDIFANPAWIMVIDILLRGGLKDGRWAFFGDFKYQVLEDTEGRKAVDAAMEEIGLAARPVLFELRENCRNKVAIGNAASLFAFGDTVGGKIYDGFLRPAGGLDDFRKVVYTDEPDQARKLEAEVKHWRDQGHDWNDITILSGKPTSGIAEWICGQETLPTELQQLKQRLKPFEHNQRGLKYGRVNAFKGLENKVIILTDVDLADNQDQPELRKSIFYTGITRSIEGVSVLWTDRTRRWIIA